jgi:GT2 family glycosyltransferase
MSEISIIIVSWNACTLLRNCLNSILTTGGSLVREIIVVDNASSDGSPDMVAKEFPEVILIRLTENSGFARGNNIGIRHASGRWLALVNSDVIVHEGCLQRLSTFLETHDGVALVGPKVIGADGHLQRT